MGAAALLHSHRQDHEKREWEAEGHGSRAPAAARAPQAALSSVRQLAVQSLFEFNECTSQK